MAGGEGSVEATSLELVERAVPLVGTAVAGLGVLGMLVMAVVAESSGWIPLLGAIGIGGGWLLAWKWWVRRQPDQRTVRERANRFLVVGWGIWLVALGLYAGVTITGATALGDASVLWCERGESEYGSASVRLVPFGLECSWLVDAHGEPAAPGDRDVHAEHDEGAPFVAAAINLAYVSAGIGLIVVTLADWRRWLHPSAADPIAT